MRTGADEPMETNEEPGFLRFPHTPHLAALGEPPRADKVLSSRERSELLAGSVIVEEKIDGANLGLSLGEHGRLRAQSRGHYLDRQAHPQFAPLAAWLAARQERLAPALAGGRILFGEWCHAVHSTRYDRLPDWFLLFDVFDGRERRFWSTERRNALAPQLGLALVPELARGRLTLASLTTLIGPSRVGSGPAEGLYVRADEGAWCASRAKLVRPGFCQTTVEHWSRRPVVRNALAPAVDSP